MREARAHSAMHLPASPWLRALAGLSAVLALACLYAAVSAPSASLLSAFVSAGGYGGGSGGEDDAGNEGEAELGARPFDDAEWGEGETGQGGVGGADLFALAAEAGREGEAGRGREAGGGKGEEDATLYPSLDGSSPVVALLAAHRRRMQQRVEEARVQAERDGQRLHAAVRAAVRVRAENWGEMEGRRCLWRVESEEWRRRVCRFMRAEEGERRASMLTTGVATAPQNTSERKGCYRRPLEAGGVRKQRKGMTSRGEYGGVVEWRFKCNSIPPPSPPPPPHPTTPHYPSPNPAYDHDLQQLHVERSSLGDSFPLLDEAAASTIAALPPGDDSLAQIHAMLATAPRVSVGEVDVEGGVEGEGMVGAGASTGVEGRVDGAVGEAALEEAVGEAVGECMDLYFLADGLQTRFHIGAWPGGRQVRHDGQGLERQSTPSQKQQQADREAELRQFMVGQLRALDDRREWWVALNLTGEQASEKLNTMPDGADPTTNYSLRPDTTSLLEFALCNLPSFPPVISSSSLFLPSSPCPSPTPYTREEQAIGKSKLSEFLFWYLPFHAWFDSEGPDHPKAVAHVEEQRAVLAAATSAATSAESTLKATQEQLWEECGLRLPHSNWTDEQSALLERYAAVANVSGCTKQCTDWEAIYPEYETQPGLVAPKHVWQKLPEHYPDTHPNISFLLTYSGRAERVQALVTRLYACTHGMAGTGSLPGIRAEMLVSVMHPDVSLEAWMQARNDTAEGIFVVPVLPRLGAAPLMFNDLARMARGELVMMLHGDALPPASCLWLDRVLTAFAAWPRLAVAGFRTDGLGEAGRAEERVGGDEAPQAARAAASVRFWRGLAEEMEGRGGAEGGEVGWRDPETGVAMHFTGLVTAFPLVLRRSVLEDMGWLDEADMRQGRAAVMSDWHLCCRAWLSGYQVGGGLPGGWWAVRWVVGCQVGGGLSGGWWAVRWVVGCQVGGELSGGWWAVRWEVSCQVARVQLRMGEGGRGDWPTVTRAQQRHVLPGHGASGGGEQGREVEYGEYDAAMAEYHDDIVKEVARLNRLLVRNH
ncbi:unnamed protein product [Closterium sp. Naga37s-1]|nr:unnamed protein product [Closterium sp. Naga37s-1]